MNTEEVLAVVVSYNGLNKTREAVEALRSQVRHVHIVDNGSDSQSVAILESLEGEGRVTLQRLPENRGVGYALNRGVERAREIGCSWLLTMDQDSVVDSSFMRAYQTAVERNPARACLAPTISDRGSRKREDGSLAYAITSGNLVRVNVFDQIGLYDEGFFIDCIDFDFSLRLRKAGYSFYQVPDAVMEHELGEAGGVPMFLRRYYARHSPIRRYYMYRNFLYMVERYSLDFPLFILKLTLSHLWLTVLVAFLDTSPRESYGAIMKGVTDYFARKQGPYVEPIG